MGHAVSVLDGQNMRRGISRDLGFTVDDRSENLRRTAEVAKLMNDAGLICLAAFLAPQEDVRQKAAEVVGRQKFLVIHLDAPIEICRARDQEGLYAAADAGELVNFPGVDAPYEAPTSPDLILNTAEIDVDECVSQVLSLLKSKQVVA